MMVVLLENGRIQRIFGSMNFVSCRPTKSDRRSTGKRFLRRQYVELINSLKANTSNLGEFLFFLFFFSGLC